MKNNQILALAVFASVVMLSFEFMIKPAFATSAYDFSLSGQNNQCDIMKGINGGGSSDPQHIYVCIPKSSTNSDHFVITYMDSNVNPPTNHTISIYPQTGGCSPTTTPCASDGGSFSGNSADKTGQSGKLQGIWCGITSCYTFWISANSYSHQLLRIDPLLNDVTGYYNITNTMTILPLITGVDIQRVGIGSVNVYFIRCPSSCTASSTGILVKMQGLGVMGQVSTIDTNQFAVGSGSSTNGWGISSMDICWFCDGNSANNVNNKLILIASRQAGTTNRMLTVDRADLMTELCGASVNGGAFTSTQNTGIIRFFNTTRWLLASDTNVYTVERTGCTKSTTISYATLGLANYVSAIQTNTTQTLTVTDSTMHVFGGVYWIQHGSSNTLSSVTQVNATTLNTLVNFDSSTGNTITNYIGGSNPFNSLVVDNIAHTLLRTDSTVKAEIIFMNNFSNEEEETPTTGGIDCTLPQNENILLCRLGGTGDSTQTGQLVGSGISALACTVVFTDCTDPDPKTNGIGLLIFIASVFVVVGMFYYSIGTEAFHIPLFIWVLIVIALSAFFTLVGLIDPVFLILSILVIVALVAPKIISTVRGNTFGSGSSA
jgi:hypothetical protein